MPEDGEDIQNNLPDQLTTLIKSEEEQTPEFIVGDGETELVSTKPVFVVEYYLSSNADTWSDATFDDYSYDLTRFLEYFKYADITDLSDLSSNDIAGFKDWRQKDGNITLVTLHGQLSNIRVFIRDCEKYEIVNEGVADSIEMPDLDDSDIVSYTRISSDEAQTILEYHQEFAYASRAHAEFALMWAILCRLGDVRSLDLDNYATDDNGDPYVEFEHDPEQDTPLKNGASDVEGKGGERKINLPEWVADIIDDYISEHRKDAQDEYGRAPLFTTRNGRVSEETLRRDLYRITQPCNYGQECPHDMDPSKCDAHNDNDLLSKCPSSVSPHPVRRGGICHQLNQGVPKATICERADVSRKVLDKHYDLRTKEEARKQRREVLKKHLDGYASEVVNEEAEQAAQNGRWPSSLIKHSPLLGNIKEVYSEVQPDVTTPSRQRAAKAVATYVLFVLLTGIDFALMGIGFNPLTMDLMLNL